MQWQGLGCSFGPRLFACAILYDRRRCVCKQGGRQQEGLVGAALAEAAIRDPELIARARRGDPAALRVLGLSAAGGAIPGVAAGAIKATRRGISASVRAADRVKRTRQMVRSARIKARTEPTFGKPKSGARAVSRDVERQMSKVRPGGGRGAQPRPPERGVGSAAEPKMTAVGRPLKFRLAYRSLDRQLTRLHQQGPVEPQEIRDTILEAGRRHGLPAAELARKYGARLKQARGPRRQNLKGIVKPKR